MCYTLANMRRGVTIAVLFLLLTATLMPLAQANGSSLPACCRASGKHHCAMMPAEDGFQSVPLSCPYRVAPAVTSGIAALVRVEFAVSVFPISSSAVAPPLPAAIPVAFGNVQKRGPPLS